MPRAALTLLLFLGSCTWAVTKDELVNNGFRRTEVFPVNYQALYRCFTSRAPIGSTMPLSEGPTAELYPDLNLGEYRLGRGKGWFMLVEFSGKGPNAAEVRAYNLQKDWLDEQWAMVAECAAKPA